MEMLTWRALKLGVRKEEGMDRLEIWQEKKTPRRDGG